MSASLSDRRTRALYLILVATGIVATLLGPAGPADATPITVDAESRAWIVSPDGGLTTLAGPAGPTGNYTTGESVSLGEYRSWFRFDLTAVAGQVVGAELVLNTGNYGSPDASETYEVRAVATPPGNLGAASQSIWIDLADGDVFGSAQFSVAGQEEAIPLNATALAALNAAVGGSFALGGHLASITAGGSDERIFLGTSVGPPFPRSYLILDVRAAVPVEAAKWSAVKSLYK